MAELHEMVEIHEVVAGYAKHMALTSPTLGRERESIRLWRHPR